MEVSVQEPVSVADGDVSDEPHATVNVEIASSVDNENRWVCIAYRLASDVPRAYARIVPVPAWRCELRERRPALSRYILTSPAVSNSSNVPPSAG